MSEKRFIIVKSIENLYALVDKEREDKEQILILSLHKEQLGVVCELLNNQQSTINKLKEAIRIAYEEKPFPRIEDIQAKFKELEDE